MGIDDTAGEVGEYVTADKKAWTQGNANPYSVAAELCAFAEWDVAEWDRHPAMLVNCAEWIAEECGRFGIPIRRLSAGEAQGGAAGVCQHVDLGAAGGGHWDCGPGFPMDDVIALAQGKPPAHAGPPKRKGKTMIASTIKHDGRPGDGYWTCTPDGGLRVRRCRVDGRGERPRRGRPGRFGRATRDRNCRDRGARDGRLLAQVERRLDIRVRIRAVLRAPR